MLSERRTMFVSLTWKWLTSGGRSYSKQPRCNQAWNSPDWENKKKLSCNLLGEVHFVVLSGQGQIMALLHERHHALHARLLIVPLRLRAEIEACVARAGVWAHMLHTTNTYA